MLKDREIILTNHSSWPWLPFRLSIFTAIHVPVLDGTAFNECLSIHPLKTEPKFPRPITAFGLKQLVASLSSLKQKVSKLGESRISPIVWNVEGSVADETLPVDLLVSLPLLPA